MLDQIISRPRYRSLILVSYLIWGAVSLRWISEYIEQGHPLTWLISVMLLLYGVLLGLEPWVTAGSRLRAHLYLTIQISLVFIASLFFYELDFFALLFLPLCGQAVFLLPRPQSTRWVVILAALTLVGQYIQFGGLAGLQFSLIYISGLILVAAFSNLTLQADASRQESESLLTELREANKQLQEYAGQAEQLAVANERNRLARDLHDSVAQTLYGLTLQSEAAARKLSSGELDPTAEYLQQIKESAQQTLVETRLLIYELRPQILEAEGLAAALNARLEAVERRSGIVAHLDIGGLPDLPSQVETNLYRISLEALNNSLKHAHASRVDIAIHNRDDRITLIVADDGVGFDPASPGILGGMGLDGMKERASQVGAQLVIESTPGQGVRVVVEVPL
jgi:signal transduction histidine kinase